MWYADWTVLELGGLLLQRMALAFLLTPLVLAGAYGAWSYLLRTRRRRRRAPVVVLVRCPDSGRAARCIYLQDQGNGRLLSVSECSIRPEPTCDAQCLADMNRAVVPRLLA